MKLYMIPINKFPCKFNIEQNIRSTLSFPHPLPLETKLKPSIYPKLLSR